MNLLKNIVSSVMKQPQKIFGWARHQQGVVDSLGGPKGVFWRLLRECDVRTGTLMGTDKYDNMYYENKKYMFARHRFVEFPYEGRMEYDGSQIPPEWHRWMQCMTDEPPSTHPPTPRKFFVDHQRNMSGSNERYVPYSTTKPKIEAWKPSN